MTLLYRWESMGMSIIRLDLTTAVGDPLSFLRHCHPS
jgi:hypothetical protein